MPWKLAQRRRDAEKGNESIRQCAPENQALLDVPLEDCALTPTVTFDTIAAE